MIRNLAMLLLASLLPAPARSSEKDFRSCTHVKKDYEGNPIQYRCHSAKKLNLLLRGSHAKIKFPIVKFPPFYRWLLTNPCSCPASLVCCSTVEAPGNCCDPPEDTTIKWVEIVVMPKFEILITFLPIQRSEDCEVSECGVLIPLLNVRVRYETSVRVRVWMQCFSSGFTFTLFQAVWIRLLQSFMIHISYQGFHHFKYSTSLHRVCCSMKSFDFVIQGMCGF